MSVLAYPPQSDEEIFRHCTKECGIITATEDQQYFALACLFCAEKFLYFDAFIGHMQTDHAALGAGAGGFIGGEGDDGGMYIGGEHNSLGNGLLGGVDNDDEEEDLTDADASLLEPQMVMIKEEPLDDALITGLSSAHELQDVADALFRVKEEMPEVEVSLEMDEQSYMGGDALSYAGYEDYRGGDALGENDDPTYQPDGEGDDDDLEANYDDLVEESLLGGQGIGLTMHIKDRKMIQFLIESYRRNHFLWDHRHPQFRDRVKRQQFLEWIIMEFKRRFNLSLAKDAVTRKWDNLRTVYKRECNRMSLEKTNVSTLWYFKELHFLNRLYGGNQKISEAVVKVSSECVYRRRYSALWNDVSTSHLLSMVQQYACFYDKYNIDYRSKEKRGEALQIMAAELSKMIDVTTIQISKRISQLRFDYAKQKAERLQCEARNKVFVPSYSYYDQMFFMDADVAPFKCEYCPVVVQTNREMDVHVLSHQTSGGGYPCSLCQMTFLDGAALNRHKQELHFLPPQPVPPATTTTALKEIKFHCDLCTASFREKSNYEEHMRRHNDELLLPALAASPSSGNDPNSIAASLEKPYACELCGKTFATVGYLNSHRALHTGERSFKCDFPQCGKRFAARQSMMEHSRQHYSEEEHKCEICGKGFKSVKNLQNHKQIHDAVKRYVCKICGSAFAQAAGLYLHKRRHNRPNARPTRQSY